MNTTPTEKKEIKKVAIYMRVSPTKKRKGELPGVAHSIEIQRDMLTKFCESRGYKIVNEYKDVYISGKNANERPGFQNLMSNLVGIDAVICCRLDRFIRSARDGHNALHELEQKGVAFICSMQPIDTSDSYGKAFFGFMAVFAELERIMILEKTEIGRLVAIDEGVKFGRKPKQVDMETVDAYRKQGWGFKRIGDKLGVAPNTIRNHLRGEK